MDNQCKKDVNVSAREAEMDTRPVEERAKEYMHEAEKRTSDAGESMGDKLEHAAHVAKENLTEATNTVKEKATEAAHTAQETAQKAKDRLEEMMH